MAYRYFIDPSVNCVFIRHTDEYFPEKRSMADAILGQ